MSLDWKGLIDGIDRTLGNGYKDKDNIMQYTGGLNNLASIGLGAYQNYMKKKDFDWQKDKFALDKDMALNAYKMNQDTFANNQMQSLMNMAKMGRNNVDMSFMINNQNMDPRIKDYWGSLSNSLTGGKGTQVYNYNNANKLDQSAFISPDSFYKEG